MPFLQRLSQNVWALVQDAPCPADSVSYSRQNVRRWVEQRATLPRSADSQRSGTSSREQGGYYRSVADMRNLDSEARKYQGMEWCTKTQASLSGE